MMVLIHWIPAQHADEFVQLQSYFKDQRAQISARFAEDYRNERDLNTKKEINYYYELFLKKLDSVENTAYIGAMVKVRNQEDINRLKVSELRVKKPKIKLNKHFTKPSYPGGMNQLSEDINRLFYHDFNRDYSGIMSATLKLIVTRDGKVSFVEAEGEHMPFNNQASVAMYLLPKKFIPAKYKGKTIDYEYQFPIKFKFQE